MPDAVHGVAYSDRSRQMVNGLRILKGSPQTLDLTDILANELCRRVEEARRAACRMNLRVQTVDDANLVPTFDQRIDQMRANESGTTNHDHAQGRLSCRHARGTTNQYATGPSRPTRRLQDGSASEVRANAMEEVEPRLLSPGAARAVVTAAAASYIDSQALDLLIQRGKRDGTALRCFGLIPAE